MTGAMTSENMSPVFLRVMVKVSQAEGVCKHRGNFMRRISGGAVWSNRPRRMCVQLWLACSAGDSPARATIRSPVAWVAGMRETDCLKPIDKAFHWGGERVTGP